MNWMLLVGALVACGGKKDDKPAETPPAKHGPIAVAVGECDAPGTTFVSGPPSRDGQTLAIVGAVAKPESPGYRTQPVGAALVAQGNLDKAVIRRYIKRNLQKIQYCYEKELLATPKLEGTLSTKFFIGPDGLVKSATGTGVDPNVASCVTDVIKTIEFPKPAGGGGVQVNYPFTFRTAGSDLPEPKPAAPKDADENGRTGTAMALDEGKMGQHDARQQAIDAARNAGILGTSLNLGSIAPLAPELSVCATDQPLPYGAFAIEWKGKGDATVIGVDNKAFADCILAAAKKWPTDKPMRCGVSFGAVPDAELHAITIDAADIKLDGNVVDHVSNVAEAKSIPALAEAFDKHLAKVAPTTVAVRGPVWLKPAPATPMSVVNAVFKATAAAKVDLVLADATGKSLRDVKPPVAPVDATKPGSWTGLMAIETPDANEAVVLSVALTKSSIFTGLSRISEFMVVEGRNWGSLEAKLLENKQSAFFSDRTDLEIGADDDVTYDDVLHVIAIATKLGFTSWKVYPFDQLTAKPTM